MKTAALGIACLLGLAPLCPAESVQFDLGGVAMKDVVLESGAGAKAESFGKNPDGQECFVEEGLNDGIVSARGLPPDRLLKSTQPGLGTYKLLPYNKPNIIEMTSREDAPDAKFVIKAPAKKYKQIGLLVASVDGDSSFTVTLRYKDGDEQVLWWEADDWYDDSSRLRPSQNIVISGMDRGHVPDSRIDKAGHYSLFEFVVPVDGKRPLESITIGTDPNRWPGDESRWAAVFAVNGETE